MLLPKPNLDKQIEIGENFSNIDTKNSNYFLPKEQLENLFRTLLHQLMTFKIRVDDLNISTSNLEPQGGDE
ncbi:restriction endonuclease subunit S [Nostoc sp.]|uniref:restriction endonuclease subunit S n=1 Tax=Nostoc sp. TaxID=1180 RepID=UPI002FF80CA6